MSSPFSQSLRALESERFVAWWALVVGMTLFAAWIAWFLVARIPLYETSATARVEADAAAHGVEARLTGRAVQVNLSVGAPVRTGDILVRLESEAQQLALQEARARMDSLAREMATIRGERKAEELAIDVEQSASAAARDEQRAILREAQARLGLAEEEARRTALLHGKGIIPEADDTRARGEVARYRAMADAASTAISRMEQDEKTRRSDRLVRIERLRGTHTRLEGEQTTLSAGVKRLEYEVERRVFRAPVDGRIAEAADLRPGGMVREGDKVASIVPEGPLRIVAHFTPASALGRVQHGQPARVRLEGFPWAEYGTVRATVSRVSHEVREGLVRVELTVDSLPSAIQIAHALPGSVEVEVERVRPATLVLRTLGGLLTRRVNAAPAHELE